MREQAFEAVKGHDNSTMTESQPPRKHAFLRITMAPAVVVFFSILLILAMTMNFIIVDEAKAFPTTRVPPFIRFNSNNELNLAIFSDLHFGEEESGWGIEQDLNTTRLMGKILDEERPNFVVLNGDLITGENTYLHNSTAYINQAVKAMVDRDIPWASTYGNHDSQFNLSREALYSAEVKHSLSYTRHSQHEVPGVTNYWLPVYPSQESGSSHAPVMILWFFDSQGGTPFLGKEKEDREIPNWVENKVSEWFTETHKKHVKKWGELPSLAFVHIPTGSFRAFQDEQNKPENFPGLNADVPLDQQGNSADEKDLSFMQALAATPLLHSVYSGHDHGNAWCGNWPNKTDTVVKPDASAPHVCFSKHTGYGGYGDWNRGSRILKLGFEAQGNTSNLTVETWVRMESGEVVTHVNLNSTYGQDIYPTADGQ